jgi:hypothetical protein
MADKMIFFENYRQAISDLLDAYEKAKDLTDFAALLWMESDFTDLLASNTEGIDAALLFDILVNRMATLETAFNSVSVPLNRMKK